MTQIKATDHTDLPEDFLLPRLLYRDALMLVVDKPAGIPVHKGPGKGPNLEQFFDALRFGLPKLPGLAHRLDKDTSGCLVLGRHAQALKTLGDLFRDGRVEKIYWAVVRGAPAEAAGVIDQPLRKVMLHPEGGLGFRMRPDPAGQNATTAWKILRRMEGTTLLELRPATGRTHQLRAHCVFLGCPIVGDRLYGIAADQEDDAPMMHLHARSITVPLYHKKPSITVTAPVPAHMQDAVGELGDGQAPG